MLRWRAAAGDARDTFWRSLQTLNASRVVIAIVPLLYLGIGIGGEARQTAANLALGDISIFYLAMALLFTVVTAYWRRRFLLQLSVQIAVDIAVIALLVLAAGGGRSGLGILFLFPLAAAAVLAPLLLALFAASIASLFLLADSVYKIFLGDGNSMVLPAGLYGGAFFAVVLMVNRLAAKLIGQEELALRRGVDLDIQQAVNRLVIADVGDGILVVGHDGRVFTGNPAARNMLGMTGLDDGFRLGDVAALQPLAQAFAAWHRMSPAEIAKCAQRAAFVIIKSHAAFDADPGAAAWTGRRELAVHLKLRFARVDTPDTAAERCVIFLQDVSAIENQAQQLKLASMGRLTASIAHEVRNPLSAIGHATSLLAEDLTERTQVRLLKIVGDNVARVNRMVEDILQLSRKVQPDNEPLLLGPFLAELKAEFSETHALADDIVWIGGAGPSPVRFDPLHLREVLVNLLNNSVRYASGKPGCIRLFASGELATRMELHVQDDGPGITPEVRAHLFEPFYTTSSKGTGLGLYLARELCLNNEAMLDYEYRFDAGADGLNRASGRFVITFALPLPV